MKEQPDIIAMQEVNQSMQALPAAPEQLTDYFSLSENPVPVRLDNHALQVARLLHEAGCVYSWTWIPAKIGYGKYDEGLALFSRYSSIAETDSFYISGCEDYHNWKTRRVLGIRPDNSSHWFYTVHMGWWNDETEPFSSQWKRLENHLSKKRNSTTVWLLGDFNSPAEVRGQGYDCIHNSGWQDTYLLAKSKDCGLTVEGIIDGWRDYFQESKDKPEGMRIDHIWCSRKVDVRSSRVIFNEKNEPKISDHFGVMIETNN